MRNKTLLSLVAGVVILYVLARVFNIVQFYTNDTPAMEPTLKVGTLIFATNLISPKRNSIVAFKINPYLEGNPYKIPSEESIYLSRIIGLENEIIQIKDGKVFINDKELEHPFGVKFLYKLYSTDYYNYAKELNLELVSDQTLVGDMAYVYLTKDLYRELSKKIEIETFDYPLKRDDLYRNNEFSGTNWSSNNFGPIEIPKDNYFMISDNRDNAMDSRIYGFIHKDEIVGVKI